MILLKNIKRTPDYISADYKFDSGDESGTMRLNMPDGTIERDGDSGYGLSHVETVLRELSESESVPSEYAVVWY